MPKIAIVTGAGSGIGKGVALELLKADYAVVLAGRRADRLEQTAADSGSARSRALVVPTDTLIPGSWLGAPHRYRIDWTSSSVVIVGAESIPLFGTFTRMSCWLFERAREVAQRVVVIKAKAKQVMYIVRRFISDLQTVVCVVR